MFSRGNSFFSMLMGAIVVSIAAMLFFQRRNNQPVLELPVRGIKTGSRMVKAGTRGVVNGAKQGLRVLSR